MNLGEDSTAGSGETLRKVTVVFSDLSGCTAITSRFFSEAAAIAWKYDGRLDRLAGDCAQILFGIPRLHEHDGVRALRTALEIHAFVDSPNTPELVARFARSRTC